MGRGRQKAKHTKLARELKSFSPDVNYAALQREIGVPAEEDEYVDKWADMYADEDEEDSETRETAKLSSFRAIASPIRWRDSSVRDARCARSLVDTRSLVETKIARRTKRQAGSGLPGPAFALA